MGLNSGTPGEPSGERWGSALLTALRLSPLAAEPTGALLQTHLGRLQPSSQTRASPGGSALAVARALRPSLCSGLPWRPVCCWAPNRTLHTHHPVESSPRPRGGWSRVMKPGLHWVGGAMFGRLPVLSGGLMTAGSSPLQDGCWTHLSMGIEAPVLPACSSCALSLAWGCCLCVGG